MFCFAHAAFWSGAAVAVIVSVLLEAEIDMLIIGFRASLTLNCIMALCQRRIPWVPLYRHSEVLSQAASMRATAMADDNSAQDLVCAGRALQIPPHSRKPTQRPFGRGAVTSKDDVGVVGVSGS